MVFSKFMKFVVEVFTSSSGARFACSNVASVDGIWTGRTGDKLVVIQRDGMDIFLVFLIAVSDEADIQVPETMRSYDVKTLMMPMRDEPNGMQQAPSYPTRYSDVRETCKISDSNARDHDAKIEAEGPMRMNRAGEETSYGHESKISNCLSEVY